MLKFHQVPGHRHNGIARRNKAWNKASELRPVRPIIAKGKHE
jgi:hypothetical protein